MICMGNLGGEMVIMNDLESPMLSYYVIYFKLEVGVMYDHQIVKGTII